MEQTYNWTRKQQNGSCTEGGVYNGKGMHKT